MTTPEISLAAINIRAADTAALADFWAGVTGATPSVNGDSAYLPPAGPHGFGIFFAPLEGPRPETQVVHVDLNVPSGTRAAEVERIIGLGAVHRWDNLTEFAHIRWTTLADPEGNLFCVCETP
ncbi:VOC family protein [Streptomyces sp. NPDC026672]|uniref:VOC family protein n=1 Tax=unclassified Streptomyces TaxID=2593676 RepID=UPI0033F77BB8